MNYLYSLILGIIQGLTEFLPVSSTAHLVILQSLWQLDPQLFGINFNIFVHAGTLFSLFLYFYQDLKKMFFDLLKIIKTGKINSYPEKLLIYIIISSLPAGLIGFFLKDTIETYFYNPKLIGVFLIIFSFIFWLIESVLWHPNKTQIPSWTSALSISLAQDIALLPGVSRSGITYCTGLLWGLEKKTSAHFAFMLSIPIIAGALLSSLLQLNTTEINHWPIFMTGGLSAAITGWIAVRFFMKVITRRNLNWFLIYRVILGLALLIFI